MSKASATGQVTVVSDGTTFHTILQCTFGDLYQTYDGEAGSPSNISPNFEAGSTKPLIVFQAFSAQEGTGTQYNLAGGTAKWYVGDTPLAFNASGVSTNSFGGSTGHFKSTTSDGNVALQVVKNLVNVNMGSSFVIKCVVTVSVDNTSADLNASIPVGITKGTENSKKVSIIAGSTKNPFTITEKGGSCPVRAMVIGGDSVVTSGLSYKWYIQGDGGAWTLKSESGSSYTVQEADVVSSTLVKLEVYKGGTLYGMDVQSVNDVSDPYILVPNCCKEGTNQLREECVRRGETGNLVYKPKLYKRGGDTAETGVKFDMYWYDNAGNSVATYENTETISIAASTIASHNGLVYFLQTHV